MNTSTPKGGGMSDTPRTDAELMGPATPFPGLDDCMQTVPASVARQLERELTEARAQNAKLVSDIYAHEHINTQMIFEKQEYRTALEEITHAGTVAWARKRAQRALDGK